MSVEKTIKLTRSDDQSITVSSGTDTFTIAFCEVPRVSDNAERSFQRIRKPLADVNETKENSPGPYYPFTIYGSPTEDNANDTEKKGSGSHFLAIKDDKAFAIRMVGDCKESTFKVKVRVGGVNVLQHTTQGMKSQDYFVVSEQKWVWGKQIDKDIARQFRVFGRGKERLSLRHQLQNNNVKKEVEIEITSRRLAQPTVQHSYRPWASLAAPIYPAQSACAASRLPASLAAPIYPAPPAASRLPASLAAPIYPAPPAASRLPRRPPRRPRPPPQPESAPPKPPSDQESIHSDPEEDMLPHQMVVGTGGLVEQIVHPDKHPFWIHPFWINDCTVTLKFKIVDPECLQTETGVRFKDPGGNYLEVPNPPDSTFRGYAPVVTNPEGLRPDIRSPMEMELEMEMNAGTRDREGKEPPGPESSSLPVNSGVGLVGDQEEGEEEEDVREFQRLKQEAKDQPRGLISNMRMKKTRRKQRKQGGVRIQMVVKPEEPKGERKSRWRTFVDAMRRILTLGR